MGRTAFILLIDDEENLRRTMALILKRVGYEVQTAATVKEARQRVDESTFDLAFLDLKLPDANGLALLPELRQRFPNMPVVILTAHDKLDAAIEAVRNGARDYLLKPVDPSLILRRVKEILDEREEANKENQRYSRLRSIIKELRSDEDKEHDAKKPDS